MVLSSRSLSKLWEQCKLAARAIGDVQARIVLCVFYFVVLGPFALVVRWARDPLAIKASTPKGWRVREPEASAPMEQATRQF